MRISDWSSDVCSSDLLKQFPVDVIKIDQSFVRDLADTPDDAAIVRALIGLGKSLSIRIVAEGIEQSSQAALLSKWGCDYGQGYLRSEEHTSELQSLMRISYAVFCLKKKIIKHK